MKGLQITAPGRFQLVDAPDPEPYADEILIKVHVCNSCTHWDLSIWEGYDIFGRPGGAPAYPYAIGGPGHEWAGEVVAVGRDVTGVRPGDRVSTGGSRRPGRARRARPGPCARPAGRATGPTASTSSPGRRPCRSIRRRVRTG